MTGIVGNDYRKIMEQILQQELAKAATGGQPLDPQTDMDTLMGETPMPPHAMQQAQTAAHMQTGGKNDPQGMSTPNALAQAGGYGADVESDPFTSRDEARRTISAMDDMNKGRTQMPGMQAEERPEGYGTDSYFQGRTSQALQSNPEHLQNPNMEVAFQAYGFAPPNPDSHLAKFWAQATPERRQRIIEVYNEYFMSSEDAVLDRVMQEDDTLRRQSQP